MARKQQNSSSAAISKSQAVREYLTDHPKAMPKEIAPAVKAAHGLDVSPQMISMIKSKFGKKRRRGGPKAKSASGRIDLPRANASRITIDDLVAAKKLAVQMGGISRAQDALAALARLA